MIKDTLSDVVKGIIIVYIVLPLFAVFVILPLMLVNKIKNKIKGK